MNAPSDPFDQVTIGGEGAPLTFEAEGGRSGPLPQGEQPPAGAIMFTPQVWLGPNDSRLRLPVSYRTQARFTEQPRWQHVWDKTPCGHGVDVPLGEWVEMDWPPHCRAQFMVMAEARDAPFWIDDLPVSPWPAAPAP